MKVSEAVQLMREAGISVMDQREYVGSFRTPARQLHYSMDLNGTKVNGHLKTSWRETENGDEFVVSDPGTVTQLIERMKIWQPAATGKEFETGASPDQLSDAMQQLQDECHAASYAAGWWHHAGTGLPYIPGDVALAQDAESGAPVEVPWQRLSSAHRDMILHYWPCFIACKIALIHAEVSEGLEAHRKDLMDDKLCHRLGLETEIADAMIRQFDLAGGMSRAARLGVVTPGFHHMNLGTAVQEKRGFNLIRPDHKLTARRASGGKKY